MPARAGALEYTRIDLEEELGRDHKIVVAPRSPAPLVGFYGFFRLCTKGFHGEVVQALAYWSCAPPPRWQQRHLAWASRPEWGDCLQQSGSRLLDPLPFGAARDYWRPSLTTQEKPPDAQDVAAKLVAVHPLCQAHWLCRSHHSVNPLSVGFARDHWTSI